MTNLTSLKGDNCETNKALANQCNVPLIGCASHRFNLAMKMFLLKCKHIIDKTNTLMGKFKNLKLAGKLRLLTSLCAIQRSTTQWSSTSEMIKRYFRLKPFFTQGNFGKMPELIDYMLSAREENDLLLLNDTLQKFNSVTIALQRESIDISEVRVLFNEIIRHIY